MTTKSDVRRYFKGQAKYAGGVLCNYCKQRVARPALYRIRESEYQGEDRTVIYAVCDDPACIAKANASRVAGQWRKW